MRLKLGDHDPILVDLKALRRRQPVGKIDLRRAPSARKASVVSMDDDEMVLEEIDSLAVLIARARRKTRR